MKSTAIFYCVLAASSALALNGCEARHHRRNEIASVEQCPVQTKVAQPAPAPAQSACAKPSKRRVAAQPHPAAERLALGSRRRVIASGRYDADMSQDLADGPRPYQRAGQDDLNAADLSGEAPDAYHVIHSADAAVVNEHAGRTQLREVSETRVYEQSSSRSSAYGYRESEGRVVEESYASRRWAGVNAQGYLTWPGKIEP